MWKVVGCLGFTDSARKTLYSGWGGGGGGEFAHASLRTFKLKFLSSSKRATDLYSYGLLLLFIHLWDRLMLA